MRNPTGSPLMRYGCAAVNIALATWVRILLDPALGDQFPYATLFFAVLFTGRWPEGMRSFVLNVLRWYLRVSTYFLLLTDEYPPFAFETP